MRSIYRSRRRDKFYLPCQHLGDSSRTKLKIDYQKFGPKNNQNNSFNPDLFSDTHTLRIQYEYTQKECMGVAIEGIDIWYMGITTYELHQKIY